LAEMKEPIMKTAHSKILPALIMFEFSSDDDQLRKHLCDAILDGKCPDFECSLGSPSGKGDSYTALWRVEHAAAVRTWAQSIGLNLNTDGTSSPHPEIDETSLVHLQLPYIGDIAPGGMVAPCLADVERLLADQHMEPTARNWVALCDHFLSLPLISVERAVAFRMLREAIVHATLGAVKINPRLAVRKTSQEAAQ
jgi:hypothetical protein